MILLGHRGARASRHIPENTIESFQLCLRHGCDGFEFDVRLTADGAAVVCHDPVTRGLEIAATSANVLALPTLQEVLQQFSSRAFLDIELKVPGLEAQTAAAVRAHPPRRGYVVSSFLPPVLSALHALDDSVPLGFLADQPELPPFDLPVAWRIPQFKLVNQDLIDQVHRPGGKIMVWTLNGRDDMLRLADWGADAIISDDTELLVRTLRNHVSAGMGSRERKK